MKKLFFLLSLLALPQAFSADLIEIQPDGESYMFAVKLRKSEIVTEGDSRYLDVYLNATTEVSDCWMTTDKVTKTKVGAVVPKGETGQPVYLLTSSPVKRKICRWSDPKVLKERFLVEWKDRDGKWRENPSLERGVVYLVKGYNNYGPVLSVYHLDMRDRAKVSFRLVERDSGAVDAKKISDLVFPGDRD